MKSKLVIAGLLIFIATYFSSCIIAGPGYYGHYGWGGGYYHHHHHYCGGYHPR